MGTYRYINRGLFERHKTTFKLMVATRIMTKDRRLSNADVALFLKAGQLADDKTKLFNWMEMNVWLNLKALSKHKFPQDSQAFFKALPDQIQRNEQTWQKWIGDAAPEAVPVPDGYEEKLQSDASTGRFMHMCLVRCLREDRTLISAESYIADTLGADFIAPVTDGIQGIWEETRTNRPVLYLLAPGSDPVGAIDELARKKKLPPPAQVSMGEGQAGPAQAQIDAGFVSGQWVILSNCHLATEYMASLEDVLNPTGKEVHQDFRLWLTCAPADDFPLGLLQMAIKVTTEPPSGLRAGLSRTFNTVVNQDFLEKVEPYEKWKAVSWTLCFLHSIVQERRKFGALGFSKAYEFNTADLEASLTFCEGHMTRQAQLNNPYSWSAMQYMIAWVQYGGRITEEEDQFIFNAYVELWITENCLAHEYCFVPQVMDYHPYQIPAALEHARHLEAIEKMKSKDIPAVFGLNNNADLTFRMQESLAMIGTLLETMPKDAGGGSGKSLNEEVQEKVEKDFGPMMPADMVWLEVVERLKVLRGPRGLGEPGAYQTLPLNVFLSQELQRMQGIMRIVKTTFRNIGMAIAGDVIMTPEIVDAINCVADLRVPRPWCYDPSGAEISWLSPSLAVWLRSLVDRHHQIWTWVSKERPPSFWLTGFFNATGFLTSMKQEVTRQKKQLQWSLDEVEYMSEVTKDTFACDDGRSEGHNFPTIQEGVLVHGLYLEGAGWHVKEERLDDAAPGERYFPFPVMKVTAVSVGMPEAGKKDQNAQARTELANRGKACYYCPLYRYPVRRMPYLIARFHLKADSGQAQPNQQKTMTPLIKWRLCGTALLCSKA